MEVEDVGGRIYLAEAHPPHRSPWSYCLYAAASLVAAKFHLAI
jgi:hypothetical protein